MGKPINQDKIDEITPQGPFECPFCKATSKELRMVEESMVDRSNRLIFISQIHLCPKCGGQIMKMTARD